MVAYGRGDAVSESDCLRIGTQLSVATHGVMSRLTDRHAFYSRGATDELILAMRSFQPDIVHLHNIHGYYLHVGRLFEALREDAVPVVWTLHDCWPFTGHCAYFTSVKCERWRTGCHQCPQRNRYPKSLLLDRSKSNWLSKRSIFTSLGDCTVVTPSRWLSGLAQDSFLGAYPMVVIPNGIDERVFRPAPSDFRRRHGLGNAVVVLGVAAQWGERKGLLDALELAKRLSGYYPGRSREGRRYRVVLVGLTEAQRRHLPPEVLGLGKADSVQGLADIYSAADFFINPTHEDNYPTVNLEAIACGTPVLTYDTGGSAECLTDPTYGRVIKSNTAAEMADVLHRMPLDRIHVDDAVRTHVSARERLLCYERLYQHAVARLEVPDRGSVAGVHQ